MNNQPKIQTHFWRGMHIQYSLNFPQNKTLVFLHDSLGCIKLWRDFPFLLAEKLQMNVFIYDRKGYGQSEALETSYREQDYLEKEADLLKTLLNQFKIHSPILFGHSDGGSIALIFGYKYPNSVSGIICEAGHIFAENITLEGIKEAIQAFENTDLPVKLKKYHGEKVQVLFDAWTKTWLNPDFSNWNIEDKLPEITCPVLFIQGEKDNYGTVEQVFKTLEKVSGASDYLLIPEVGHSPHKEKPQTVIIKCTEFLFTHKLA